jgi:LacI family transcriptional regulator
MPSRPTSIRDVARDADVSIGTVSNVLNNPALVAAATRERVLTSIERLGFVRNESARQLRAGRARTLGLIVFDVANPFFTDIARGVEDGAREAGYAVILCNSDDSIAKERAYLDVLYEQRVSGTLITPVDRDRSRLERLRAGGVCIVLLDHAGADDGSCAVGVDDVAGGDLAMTHLLAEGYRSIVHVTGPLSIQALTERLAGARRALGRAGRDPAELVTINVPTMTLASGQRAARELLASRPLPEAVMCANDLLALGMLQEVMRAGLHVPEDVAIIGYDDIDLAAASAIPLTSVRQPRRELGRRAAELLIEEIESPAGHRHDHVVFQPELVVRESSRRPRRLHVAAGSE